MNDTELTVGGIIENGISTGLKNATALVGAVALWLLTLWIPYLNVGTTIGLLGLVAAMSKGERISPTEIFKSHYRERMGEFFLVLAFVGVGVFVGLLFVGIPGIVIALSWSLAALLVVDQGVNPAEALTKSNELTHGRKVTLFFGLFLTQFAATAVVMLVTQLGGLLHGFFGLIFAMAGYVLIIAAGMGANAYVYGTLTGSWPKSERRFQDTHVVGGAIGAAVLSIVLMAVISSLHTRYMMKKFDEEFRTSRYDYAPPSSTTRIAPSLRDEPEAPPAKNVATSKQATQKKRK